LLSSSSPNIFFEKHKKTMKMLFLALLLTQLSYFSVSGYTTATVQTPLAFSKPSLQVTWELDVASQIRQRPRLDDRPYMVGIVGIPGSGKSTGAEILTELCGDDTLCMPFDGYHHSVKELQQMINPDDKIYRRGAPDTFDAAALYKDLQRIRYGSAPTVSLPGFDHAVGDPEQDKHLFARGLHQVVVTEGLYLLHDQDGWESIKECFDLTVYVDADLHVCMDRLKIRNQSIPGYTAAEISVRVDAVDRVNAHTVEDSKRRADLVVRSATFR
jgi:pantothenate kinase